MGTILHLPSELIRTVLTELSLNDICNLLLTCKGLYEHILPEYARNRFETVCVMLNQHCLNYLHQVIERPVYARAVRRLVICSDYLSHAGYLYHAQNHPWHREDNADSGSISALEEYSERLADQTELIQCGRATEYLRQALIGLSNCRSIIFSDSDEHDPIGRSRLARDFGVRTSRYLVKDVNGIFSNSVIRESEEIVSDAIATFLLAAARSGLRGVQFEVMLGLPYHEEFTNAITSDMLALLTARDEIQQADLTNISMLRLVVYATSDNSAMWTSDIIQFIALFPRLRHLRLHFKNLGKSLIFESLCQGLHIQDLQSLELSRLYVTETELMGMLARHKKTLKQVTLEQIEFKTPQGWPCFLLGAKYQLSLRVLRLNDCLVKSGFWYTSNSISSSDDYNRVIAELDWHL